MACLSTVSYRISILQILLRWTYRKTLFLTPCMVLVQPEVWLWLRPRPDVKTKYPLTLTVVGVWHSVRIRIMTWLLILENSIAWLGMVFVIPIGQPETPLKILIWQPVRICWANWVITMLTLFRKENIWWHPMVNLTPMRVCVMMTLLLMPCSTTLSVRNTMYLLQAVTTVQTSMYLWDIWIMTLMY